MFRQMAWVVMLLGCVSVALGDVYNWIYQHNTFYNDPNSPGYPFYLVNQDWRQVTVLHGVEGQVFEFEAVIEDNGQYVGPGDIDRVLASTGAGPVVVTFVGDNGHPYGAANIKEARIGALGYTGTIKELNISGDLGELGPVVADVLENVTVAGDVYYLASLGAITGSLTVGGDVVA